MTNKQPPAILVKTWYDLVMQKDNAAAKKRAAEMLIATFGDMPTVIEYLRQNKLLVKPSSR